MDKFQPAIAFYKNLVEDINALVNANEAEFENHKSRLEHQIKVFCDNNDLSDEEMFPFLVWVDESIRRLLYENQKNLKWLSINHLNIDGNDVGDIFFDKLSSYLGSDKHDDALIFYYLSLVYGFRGKYYKEEDDSYLKQIKREVITNITNNLKQPQSEIQPSSAFIPLSTTKNTFMKYLTYLIPVTIIITMYFLMRENILESLILLSIDK